ncbi:MAG TPA: uroporphyrinogen decarboxylase family protein [Candidatus Lokiarchaeia archaeon]|nr:uroporphyrinogen decarboxylase family protein [Candidatus Lokiarchaeia archaeon]
MYLETDSMTQRERLDAVLNHQQPDRLPFYLMGYPRFGSFYQEFLKCEDELLDAYTGDDRNVLLTPCGDYTINAFFGADIITRGLSVDYPKHQWLDEQKKFTDHGIMVNGKQTGFRVNYFGYLEREDLLPNGETNSWYYGPFMKTQQEFQDWFDTYGWPHELEVKAEERVTEINETNAKFSHAIHVIPSYDPSPFTHLWMMLGNRIAYFYRKCPDFVKKIVDSMAELQIKQVEKMKPLQPVAVFNGDDLGQKDRAMLSPAQYHEFFFDARKRVNDAIHDIGAKSIQHSCGNAVELLPELVASGLDGWQSLEPASGIDHAWVKKNFGDTLSFWGAIDNNVLCFGTAADVEAEVKQKIQTLAPGGGYVIGPAHDYLNTRVDNAIALREAAKIFGAYPLE